MSNKEATLHCALPDNGATDVIAPDLPLRVTYDSFREQVFRLVDTLTVEGFGSTDRIALVMPNGIEGIIALLAASIAGVAVPLNPAYTYSEFLFYLEDAGARLLLCPPDVSEAARRACLHLGIPLMVLQTQEHGRILSGTRSPIFRSASRSPQDTAVILYTSGSTGRPRAVPLRHSQLVASAQNVARTYSLGQDDVSFCVMPMFHIHGIVASTLATFMSRGTLVIPNKFNPFTFWQHIQQWHVTWYSAVPSMHRVLLARARENSKARSLRFVRSCSAPFAADTIGAMEETLGIPVVEAYGMTEAAHQVSSNPLPPGVRKPGSVGLPFGLDIAILNDHGQQVGSNQRGEVAIRGGNVFQGYEKPEDNRDAFVRGWFRTGDEGYLDCDQYLHLTGRIKEIIIRGGEKISPLEIDRVLSQHPSVLSAAAFGYPHPTLGEEVGAAIVLNMKCAENESSILEYCRQHLAEFKCPKRLFFVDTLPTTPTGKIRRNAVANAVALEKKAARC